MRHYSVILELIAQELDQLRHIVVSMFCRQTNCSWHCGVCKGEFPECSSCSWSVWFPGCHQQSASVVRWLLCSGEFDYL